MNHELIRTYAKKIQGFAWQKTRHPQDAEDLAQEIFLTLCRMDFATRQIENMDAFIYRICSYTWSNFIRKRMRDREHRSDPEGMEHIPSGEDVAREVADVLERDETYARLYREIAYLSRTRREIIRRHYFGGESSRTIGEALGLSDATVRWYLGESQKRLKERMSMKQNETLYEPKRLQIAFSGHSASDTMYGLRSDLLMQNICLVCATRRGMTVEEVAARLSMSAAFIEDKLDIMLHMAYLEPIGNSGRYRTTFLIEDADYAVAHAAWLREHLTPVAHRLYKEVHTRLDRIRAIGFMGCDMNENFLMWLFVTMAGHIHACRLPCDSPEAGGIPRGDGSCYWVLAAWQNDEILRARKVDPALADFICHFKGFGAKYNGNGRVMIHQFDPPVCTPLRSAWDPDRCGYFGRVRDIIRDHLPLSDLDWDVVVFLADQGYARVENNRPVLCVPYLTAAEWEALRQMIEEEVVPAVLATSENLRREHAAFVSSLLPDYIDEEERNFVIRRLYYPKMEKSGNICRYRRLFYDIVCYLRVLWAFQWISSCPENVHRVHSLNWYALKLCTKKL